MDKEEIHVHLHLPEELFRGLGAIRAELREILALVTVDSTQIDSVVSALASLKTDTAAALADIAAKLAAGQSTTADPATAAIIASAIADIGTLDGSIKAADPGPITPVIPPPAA